MTKMAAAAETSAAVTFWERYKMKVTYLDNHPINRLEAIDYLAANYQKWGVNFLEVRSLWKQALAGSWSCSAILKDVTGLEVH